MASLLRLAAAWTLLVSATAAVPSPAPAATGAPSSAPAATGAPFSAPAATGAPSSAPAATGAPSSAPAAAGRGSPTFRLFNRLLITFGAIWLGRICVRLKLVKPEEGDLKAMGFYTGKVAFPLLIFSTVATAELGDVNMATLAACSLGKVVVMAIAGLLAFFAYQPQRSKGQQVLTGTVFAFFAVSSNDFAIGFPVIEALYGPSMAVYIAANSLVGSFFFVPLTMAFFSLGQALLLREGGKAKGKVGTFLSVVKDVLLNPVITFTLAGLLYKTAFSFTLTKEGGSLVLPSLLHQAVKLLTAPFVMSALFLTGTSLRSARLARWPAALVLMKVVVCAFFSFLFAILLVDGPQLTKERLINFAFFYGSIPTSSAPLVFASQFDPGAVELIATAILLGLLLAGPVMLSTSVLLSDMGSSADDVASVQLSTIGVSLVCGVIFLVLLGILRREWGFTCPVKKLLAVYGVMLFVYEFYALFYIPRITPVLCGKYRSNTLDPPSLVLGWMQSSLALIRLVLQFMLIFGPKESPRKSRMGNMIVGACLGLALLPAFAASPTTIEQICHGDVIKGFRLIAEDVWTGLLLVASVALALVGICKKRSATRLDRTPSSEGDSAGEEEPGMQSRWVCEVPKDVLLPITVLFTLNMLIRFVNSTIVLISAKESTDPSGSFLLMLMLETILSHGQLAYLTLAIFISKNLTEHAADAVPRLCPCLRRQLGSDLSRQKTPQLPDGMLGSVQVPEEVLNADESEDSGEESLEESEDSVQQLP